MAAPVEIARQQWAQGHHALESALCDPAAQERLLAELAALTDELRRRVGQTFSLAELAAAYAGAERWAREAVERDAPFPGWPRDLVMVQDAAFHLYARGATDYRP